MKLYENFYCLVEVVCEHWYLGTDYKQFAICYEDDEFFDDKVETYQKITDTVLNKIDKNRMYEDYSIKLQYFYGEKTEKVELSEQFIINWKNANNIIYRR